MGKNTDFTGLAILLGLGYLVLKLEGFKMPSAPAVTYPTAPGLPTGFFSFLGNLLSRKNGLVPSNGYTPQPYYPPYTPPPALTLTEEQETMLARIPGPIPDLHKALRETTGKTARFIIERKIAPAPPKLTDVKDLHKEMTALKTQTALWIAERPELWGGENGK